MARAVPERWTPSDVARGMEPDSLGSYVHVTDYWASLASLEGERDEAIARAEEYDNRLLLRAEAAEARLDNEIDARVRAHKTNDEMREKLAELRAEREALQARLDKVREWAEEKIEGVTRGVAEGREGGHGMGERDAAHEILALFDNLAVTNDPRKDSSVVEANETEESWDSSGQTATSREQRSSESRTPGDAPSASADPPSAPPARSTTDSRSSGSTEPASTAGMRSASRTESHTDTADSLRLDKATKALEDIEAWEGDDGETWQEVFDAIKARARAALPDLSAEGGE